MLLALDAAKARALIREELERSGSGETPAAAARRLRREPRGSGLMSIAPAPERLDAILARHDIVMATLNAGPEPETFVALSRELSELDPVVARDPRLSGGAGEPARARGA